MLSRIVEPSHDLEAGDIQAIIRLRTWGGEQLLRQLAALFRTDTPRRIATAREAARQADWPAVKREAHALRSSSGQMGAMRMADTCAAIEMLGAGDQRTAIPSLVEALDEEFANFALWLEGITTERRNTEDE